jgi:DNA-directed RNA polymerase specialized sigma24 family protein
MVEADDARISDETLIGRTAAGDAASFARLVRRHQTAVYRFARAVALEDTEAEEILLETFRIARSSALRHRDEPSALPWLLAIAHQAVERRRPTGRTADLANLRELARAAGWGEAPRLAEAAPDLATAGSALAALSPEDREILTLCDREYFTVDEAARVTGDSEAGTRARLHRARLRLTARLREGPHGD